MKFSERVKNMIRSWLNIQPSPMNTVSLYEAMPFELRTIEAMLWYRGDAAELDQFYKQAGNDNVMRARFWAYHTSASTRKIHTGLPAMMVDTLAYLVKTDMDDVRLQDDERRFWAVQNSEWRSGLIQFVSAVMAGVPTPACLGRGMYT